MTNAIPANGRIRNSGGFELPLPAAKAFPLFTAEGESRWVPGWCPEILGSLPQNPGLVFITGTSTQQTIWTVLESDAAKLRHRYSRVTPGHTAGTVEVELHPAGSDCRVEVSYDLTALSPEGEQALAGYSGTSFTAMLDQWRTLIASALSSENAVTAA